ncbi:MAG: hypothetical protein VYD70_08025 [Planctomycetota bacterium]|nr:hypothetical protein [Planctomycetota bacterium]
MKSNNHVVLAVGSMVALLLSIPLGWFQISGFAANGINGSLTFIVQLPIWLVVVLGVLGVSFSLLNQLRLTSIPKFVCLGFLMVSSLYVLIAVVLLPSSSGIKLEIGPFIALLGLVLGYCHVLSGSKTSDRELSSEEVS